MIQLSVSGKTVIRVQSFPENLGAVPNLTNSNSDFKHRKENGSTVIGELK